MKIKYKIAAVILTQIVLVISSFSILTFYENETSMIGNSINISGLNRFLAMRAHNLVDDAISMRTNHDPMSVFEDLNENIQFLKQGGQKNSIQLPPIHDQFSNDLDILETRFQAYKKSAQEVLDANANLQDQDGKYENFDLQTDEFISQADMLTTKLAIYEVLQSDRLISLEIALMISNISISIFCFT